MKRALTLSLAFSSACFALACDSEPSNSGLDEPLRVGSAFFRDGELPGIPVDELPSDPEELLELTPRVPAISPAGSLLRPGQAGVSVRGTATEDTYAIGIRLADIGSGYWIKPVGGLTGLPNEREWDARLDLSPDVPSGKQVLEVVAIDGDGKAGPQATFTLCVTREVEHSRNACDPTELPPAAIIALSWDTDADVDLVVVTPSGKTIDATSPTTIAREEGEELDYDAPGQGVLSLDSNDACRRDGVQRELLTWNVSPEPGKYQVYARLFEPCGTSTTNFKVEGFVRTAGDEDGTYGVGQIADTIHGVLLAQGANGNRDLGVFVTTIEFP
jgi:hypothetical protein